jgi:hypothetical protein
MIRKNDDDLLNVCNPGIASDFDLLVSLSPLFNLLAVFKIEALVLFQW